MLLSSAEIEDCAAERSLCRVCAESVQDVEREKGQPEVALLQSLRTSSFIDFKEHHQVAQSRDNSSEVWGRRCDHVEVVQNQNTAPHSLETVIDEQYFNRYL